MPETRLKYPAEFYESGEAMPDSEAVTARYSSSFDEANMTRIKEIMAKQKTIEPVLKYFVETGYRATNKLLRGQTLRKHDADYAKEAMVKIDEAFKSDFSKLTKATTVYRGITADFARILDEALKSDGLFYDVGYVIASTVEKRHVQNAIQIELPVGTSCMSLNKFLINEVVLPHGSRFKVSESYFLPDGKARYLARWLGA